MTLRHSIPVFVLLLALAACARADRTSASRPGPPTPCARGLLAQSAAEQWREATCELASGRYQAAEFAFTRLAREHAGTAEGRGAWYYLGLVYLDARNPRRDLRSATRALRTYLSKAVAHPPAPHAVEAAALLSIAETSQARAQAEATTSVRARSLAVRVDSLSAQLRRREAELQEKERELERRAEELRQQARELERMRRVLAPRSASSGS